MMYLSIYSHIYVQIFVCVHTAFVYDRLQFKNVMLQFN